MMQSFAILNFAAVVLTSGVLLNSGGGCSSSKSSSGEMYSIEKDSSDRITGKGPVVRSDAGIVNHGVWQYFKYVDGDTVLKERTFSYGIMQGEGRDYYSSGHLQTTAEFRMNRKDGMERQFLPDGRMSSEIFWKCDMQGLSKWYYQDGDIKLINVCDFDGTPIYVQHWDSVGTLLVNEGLAIGKSIRFFEGSNIEECAQEVMADSIRRDSVITGIVIAPTIEGLSNNITVTLVDADGKIVKTYVPKVINCFACFPFSVSTAGNFRVLVSSKMMDERLNVVHSDYVELDIKVR